MISQREGKSFIFCFALWGTAKVVCGYLLLLTVINFWGHTYPFDITLLEIATSLSFITSGKCTIAFAYFRGKASRLVLTTSIMSVIFAICLFLILVTSAENHDHCEGTIECVTFFSIVLNGIYLFFLIKLNRSRTEFEVQEEVMDVPIVPSPLYEVVILIMFESVPKGTLSNKNNDIIWEFFPNVGPPSPPHPLLGTPYPKKILVFILHFRP